MEKPIEMDDLGVHPQFSGAPMEWQDNLVEW